MNTVFFGLKRAYYGTLRGMRKPLKKLGLTPARVDLLTAVARSGERTLGLRVCLQRELRDVLGVVASTLTQMIQALEKLGLVKRSWAHDRRFRVVELTERGKELLAKADQWALRDEKELASPFVEPEGRDGIFYGLFDMPWDEVDEVMKQMVRDFGSIGPYPPWHPDG